MSKEEAQSDICQAIADGAVQFRCRLKRHTTKPMTSKTVLDGNAFEIPTLKPHDLDWEGSRPLKPWTVRRGMSTTSQETGTWGGSSFLGPTLRTFCAAPGRAGELPQPTSSETGARRRSRPTLESAQRVIRELFPEGVPEQSVIPTRICAGSSVKSSRNKDCRRFRRDDFEGCRAAQIAQEAACGICRVRGRLPCPIHFGVGARDRGAAPRTLTVTRRRLHRDRPTTCWRKWPRLSRSPEGIRP